MYIGQGVKSGAQLPGDRRLAMPCLVLLVAEAPRVWGQPGSCPPGICLLKCNAYIEKDVRTFEAIEAPA